MKVLLLANPPMGDKFAHRLQEIPGVEVDYRRMQKTAAQSEAVRSVAAKGVWVVAMSVNGAGAGFKEIARTRGAHYVSLPPSWAAAEEQLREQGFFKALHEARLAAPLTHHMKPTAIAIDGAPVVEAMIRQLGAKAVLPLIPTQGTAEDRARDTEKVAASVGLVPGRRAPTQEARKAGNESMKRKAAERQAYARELFERDPGLSPQMANQMVTVRFGRSTSEQALYRLRRDVCAAKGLPPPSGSYARARGSAPRPDAPAARTTPSDTAAWAATLAKRHVERPITSAANDQGLDALTDLKAAISLMWHEAKRAGVTLLSVSGSPASPPKVTLEREVRVFEKGDLKVDM
jgi:hypothetical protein